MTSKRKTSQIPQNLSLSDAAAQYLVNLTPEKRQKNQSEITKFVRWYGEGRTVNSLTGQEVEDYTGHMTSTITELNERLDPIKDFLSYAHKHKMIDNKMAHLIKVKKSTTRITYLGKQQEQSSLLTPEGFAALESELQSLIAQRPKIVDEIRKAAADKDFRENAPLEAAREQQGKNEGRIKELEAILKSASLINEKLKSTHGATIGDNITLRDLTTGDIVNYTLVDMREANPSKGKISINSPIGKALLGHKEKDKIEVIAPAGVIPYEIEEIRQS